VRGNNIGTLTRTLNKLNSQIHMEVSDTQTAVVLY